MKTHTIEGFSRYFAREDGEIISTCWGYERVLKGNIDHDGYRKMVLVNDYGKHVTMKRCAFVCRAFHGPRPSGMVTRHIDGTKTNDRPCNLEWGSQWQNSMDRHTHGTMLNKNYPNAIPESVVRYMRNHPEESVSSIARRFNVGRRGLAHAKTGRTWAWLK